MAIMTRSALIGLLAVLAGALAAQSDYWSVKSGFVGREGHASVTFNGRMWVIGGQSYNVYMNDVWSSANGIDWTLETGSAPWSPRSEHAAVVFNNRIWVIGGSVNGFAATSDVWSSQDGANWTLETAAAPWVGRQQHTVTVFNGELWLMGGASLGSYGMSDPHNDVWTSSDGINWTQRADAPWSARWEHAAVVFNNELVVLGGNEGWYFVNDVWAYDGSAWSLRTNTAWPGTYGAINAMGVLVYNGALWSVAGERGLGPLGPHAGCGYVLTSGDGVAWTTVTTGYGWAPRTAHTALVFNSKMWILGGHANGWSGGLFENGDPGEVVNDVWSSTNGMIWNRETPDGGFNAWQGRAGHTAEEFNNRLWVLGGMTTSAPGNYTFKRDVWSSQDGLSWTQSTATAGWAGRWGHTSAVFNSRLWVLGGDASGMVNDVWSSADGITWAQISSGASSWSARKEHATVAFQGKLWVLGGEDGGYCQDVWSSPDGANWTLETAAPGWSARSQHTAVVFNNRIWVLGGWNGTSYFHDVWSSADGANWTLETAAPDFSKRYGHASVVAGGRIWMFGGKAHPPGLSITGTNWQSPVSEFTATAAAVPSGEQSFSVTAANMSAALLITPPAEFEIATIGSSFQSGPLALWPTSGALAPTTIRFRYHPASAPAGPAHVGDILVECGQALRTVAVRGTISASGAPAVTLTGGIAPFDAAAGMPTPERTYTVAGANLSADLVITAPLSFEIALVGGSFGASLSIAPSNGTVPPTAIRVRYNTVSGGWQANFVVHSSTGAVDQLASVSSNDATASAWPLEVNDVWSSADGINWLSEPNAPFNARIGSTLTGFSGGLWMLGGAHICGWGAVTGGDTIPFTAEVWRVELPAVRLTSAVYSATEGAGQATLTVELNQIYAFNVSMDFVTANGTATEPQDYNSAAGTVTIAAGQTSASFTVQINDDQLDEQDETLQVSLVASGGAALGAQANATLNILDDDGAPIVRFAAASYSAGEASGTVTLTIELSNVSGLDVTVDVASSDNTASAGLDYTAVNLQVVIPVGSTSVSMNVGIIQDPLDESDETLALSLANPQSAGLGALSSMTVTIADDDAEPELNLAITTLLVNEADGTFAVTVTLSNPSSAGVTVDYATQNGSAFAGADYAAAVGTVTFAPGTVSQTISITMINDAQNEPSEWFELKLSNPAYCHLGANTQVTFTIQQDQSDMFQVGPGSTGGGGNGNGGGCAANTGGSVAALLALLLMLGFAGLRTRKA